MKLDDISPALFEEREEHFLKQFTIEGQPSDDVAFKLARRAAAVEMLNEQHVMLRAICHKLGIPIPHG